MRKPSMIAAPLLFVFCYPTAAQNTKPDIVTDRPDITESAIVIPRASFQLENGLTWTSDHGKSAVDLSESLVRIGLLNKTEFRLGIPNFSDGIQGIDAHSGFGDLSVGVKQQLGPVPGGIDVAVIAAISLPTGNRNQTTGGYDPFVKIPWAKELKEGWSVGGQQSVFWQTEAEGRNAFWEPTVYLEKEITKPWDVFVEYAGDYYQRGDSKQILHFGTAYKIRPQTQLDFHFGFGLNHATPNHFFAVGYSFRLDPHRH